MNTSKFGCQALLAALLAAVLLLSGCTSQTPKVYHVGILSGLDFFANTTDGFKSKMTELGYVEGKNIVYDVQTTNVDMAAYKSILQKFVADKVDLIFVFPTEAALEAKTITQGTDIPVLFAQAFTEGFGLVESVRQPGGNITGVRYPGPDLAVKGLEILLEVAPQAKRIWVPYLQGYPSVPAQLEALHPVAASLGITLVEVPATSTADIEADLQARAKLTDIGLDAILEVHDPLATWPDATAVISKFAAEHKLPYLGTGGMCIIILTTDSVQVGKLAAPMADKILKGTPAGTIPVVSADPVLTINYAVAQELGLTVPEGLLIRADKIIR